MSQSKNCLSYCLLLGSVSLVAQNKILKGKITTAKDNTPVSGATVSVKGTSNSVAASSDGTFSIPVSSSRVTLIISSVGYANREYTVDARQNDITIPLETNEALMGEVVVVGYGSQKKSDLTGAISSVRVLTLHSFPPSALTRLYRAVLPVYSY